MLVGLFAAMAPILAATGLYGVLAFFVRQRVHEFGARAKLTAIPPRSTVVYMSTTITIRADEQLRRSLQRRAREQGKSVSEVAREILRSALEQRPLELRTGHLRGRLRVREAPPEAWRKTLRERNWRT